MPNIFENITGITAERAFSFSDDPEMKNPATKQEWLKFRRSGIGASDISAIAGINPWHSPIDVYLDKKGLSKDQGNEKMKWGNLLEQPVADEFAVLEQVKVQRVNAILRHKEKPFLLTSLDRVIRQNGSPLPIFAEHGNGALEVKTTGWGQSWENGNVPDYYFIQLQWELHISGLQWGRFATLISGQELLITPVIMADKQVAEKLQYLAEKFWHNHVEKSVVPEPSSPADLDSVKKLWDKDSGTTITFPSDFDIVLSTRAACAAQIDQLDNKRKILDAQILNKLGNNKYGIGSAFKVTKVIKNSLRLDNSQIKEKYPAAYSECLVPSNAVYTLLKPIT